MEYFILFQIDMVILWQSYNEPVFDYDWLRGVVSAVRVESWLEIISHLEIKEHGITAFFADDAVL